MAAPAAGVAHPVRLGAGFSAAGGLEGPCLLRYDFKPASAGRQGVGSLEIDHHAGQARPAAAVEPLHGLHG